jgi:ubiquinone/menaquinone biosynthesis C-methylase UbiE
MSNLSSSTADLTKLPFESESIESLSCMHVIEHIGLGRYNDTIDIDGDKKAALELTRVLEVNGRLIVAIPVGRPRIQFNAHRIYSHEQVQEMFSGLTLVEYALVPDGTADEGLIMNPDSELINAQNYGCGCYVFAKQH